MKKLIAIILVVGAFAARAAEVGLPEDYTDRTLWWQINPADVANYGASHAYAYAVLKDGETIEFGEPAAAYAVVGEGGVPTGVKTYSNFGVVDLSGATFYAELLEVNGEEFTSLAKSEAVLFEKLWEQYFSGTPKDESMHAAKVNTGGSYAFTFAVPEPTSGLLLLIGIAGLALRRRRTV